MTAIKTGLNHELLISLPENYAATQVRYPVLFVLDGWHFPFMDFMQNNNRFSRRPVLPEGATIRSGFALVGMQALMHHSRPDSSRAHS